MLASVIIFPGTNREKDMVMALKRTGFEINLVWHMERQLPKCDLVVLPGGFSYGDYLRCGAMAANSPIMRDVIDHAHKGGHVFGVCNGFQMLVETGLLPGALMRNSSLKFICKRVDIVAANTDNHFMKSINKKETLKAIPIAHGEGNYFADPDTLKMLQDTGRIAFTYVDNPNGSQYDIAGIVNDNGNILGMMPHPENAISSTHGGIDGMTLFQSMAK